MRIGFITSGSEQDLAFAQQEGIPCVEINIHDNLEQWESRKEQYKALCEQYGIEVVAMGLWGRNYISYDDAERERCFNELRRHIDLAAFLGAKVVMTGGGLNADQTVREMALRACELFPPVVEYAQSKGLKFGFYNCHWTNHITGPEAWDIVLDRMPTVGIKFDPSHPFYYGEDYLQHMCDYGERIFHVHAKGCVKIRGERFDDPPPGMDQIQWGTFFAILYHHNYEGDVVIEPHSHTWMGERLYQGIRFAKRFLEQFIV